MLLETFRYYGTKERADFTTDILCRWLVTVASLYGIEAVSVAFVLVGALCVLRENG